jgi:tetraacyldisaccharide 4'-kinase
MSIFENRIYRTVFFPLSLIYRPIVWIRNKCYDKEVFRSLKINKSKVISVGNISVGGTGKTPVIKFLADYLTDAGFKVAVLSRGYKRESKGSFIVSDGKQILSDIRQAGDEPFLLASKLPNVPVVAESDRHKGALLIEDRYQPDVILLDDGFQHRRLARDLDIVTVDASAGFGRGLLLPAGFLREPIGSLKRANLIWLTRVNQSKNSDAIVAKIKKVTQAPIISSYHQPEALIHAATYDRFPLSYLNQKKVLLFSGIANHLAFEKTVLDLGAIISDHKKFPDHYHYQPHDVETIVTFAKSKKAQLILTTEKDFVRLKEYTAQDFQFYYLTIEIRICNNEEKLQNLLTSIL